MAAVAGQGQTQVLLNVGLLEHPKCLRLLIIADFISGKSDESVSV